eukprot:5917485-Pleurochrysis_carterae.AAC.1
MREATTYKSRADAFMCLRTLHHGRGKSCIAPKQINTEVPRASDRRWILNVCKVRTACVGTKWQFPEEVTTYKRKYCDLRSRVVVLNVASMAE